MGRRNVGQDLYGRNIPQPWVYSFPCFWCNLAPGHKAGEVRNLGQPGGRDHRTQWGRGSIRRLHGKTKPPKRGLTSKREPLVTLNQIGTTRGTLLNHENPSHLNNGSQRQTKLLLTAMFADHIYAFVLIWIDIDINIFEYKKIMRYIFHLLYIYIKVYYVRNPINRVMGYKWPKINRAHWGYNPLETWNWSSNWIIIPKNRGKLPKQSLGNHHLVDTVDGSEFLHQLIWRISHCLPGFLHPNGGC